MKLEWPKFSRRGAWLVENGMSVSKKQDIFGAAAEIESEAERTAMLDSACGSDQKLRQEVEELLRTSVQAEGFFAECTAAIKASKSEIDPSLKPDGKPRDDAPKEKIGNLVGTNIGLYKLMQVIGEGGCGAVYMAEQEKPVRRHVALKVIKLGMDTKSVIARFEAEQHALALMDHPSIARVLDAGATASGRPYFVMELVRGVKITTYCDDHRLDVRERLRLFIQVCQAVQHAHQKGIIHRDLKPSNILVATHDGLPVPKVIDFGIAKAMDGRLTDRTLLTPHEHFIGTPAYMSPEQAELSGLDVDTRSDIYSLGVLLYELLTGKTPFDQKELMASGLDSMRRTIQEKEPPRPSTRLSQELVAVTRKNAANSGSKNGFLYSGATNGGGHPGSNNGAANSGSKNLGALTGRRYSLLKERIALVRGDLDWIVMKTLDKDRGRRYETANGLALEIQRYLNNEPVVARPPSRLYRLRKLVRRNRAVFAAGTGIALALAAGFGISTWMFFGERAARQEQVRLRQVASRALENEARLRKESENRERFTQAAFLVSRERFSEADEVVDKVAIIEATLETGSVLRRLGEWHALRSEWDRAAARFDQLLQADQQDNSGNITMDLLMAGPIQIERGNLKGYEHFRRAAIARMTGTTDAIDAERTLKISLLLPANAEVMKSLKPFDTLASESFEKDPLTGGTYPLMAAWRCISLALMAYRQNYTPTAIEWCRQSLAYQLNTPARIATAHIISAMAAYQLNYSEEARSELDAGRTLVESEFSKGLSAGNGGDGFWFDWLFARVLLREAETLIR
jgi:serine/threonine protein kinase